MADSDSAVSEQLAALVTAINAFQDATLETVEQDRKALLEALAALGDLDSTVEDKVIAMIGQPSSYFNNLTDLVKQVMAGMPDLGGLNYTLPDTILLDDPTELQFSGATSASGQPVIYKLSNPVNCTVSDYELEGDEKAILTPLGQGPGSVTMTAFSNGVPASPVIIKFNVVSGHIDMTEFSHTVTGEYLAGQSTTVSFGGATTTTGKTISYRLSDLQGVSASAETVSEGGSVALTVTGSPGSTASFNVVAIVDGVESEPEEVRFLIKAVTIDMSGFSHNAAGSYQTGQTASIRLSGATASDGSTVSYRLSSLQGVSASSVSVSEGGNASLNITGSSGSTASFNVVAVSNGIESAPVQISFSIMAVTIDMSGFSHNAASSYKTGQTASIRLSGATATDGSTVSYRLSSLQGVSASSVSVSEGGNASLNITGSAGSTASFTVVAVSNGIESSPVQISFSIMAVTIDMSGFSHNVASVYPSGDSASIRFSGARASDGSAVTYQFSNLVGCSLSSMSASEGQYVTLNITGSSSGLIAVTAVAGGITSSAEILSFSIQTGTLNTPSIISPYNGATNVSLTPVLTCSSFSVSPAGFDSHGKTQWKVKNNTGTVIWTGESSGNSISIPTLPGGSQVRFQVRHYGNKLGWTNWSTDTTVQTKQDIQIGHVYPDGGIAGPVIGGRRLIIAPASKRFTRVAWGLGKIATNGGTGSGAEVGPYLLQNFRTTTDSFGNVGPVAVLKCQTLGSQWFLPSKNEMAEIVRHADLIDSKDTSGGTYKFSWMRNASSFYDTMIWTCTTSGTDQALCFRCYPDNISQAVKFKTGTYVVIPVRYESI